jgi:hypothetical protein
MVAYYVLYITKEEDDECSDDMVVVVEMVCGGLGHCDTVPQIR